MKSRLQKPVNKFDQVFYKAGGNTGFFILKSRGYRALTDHLPDGYRDALSDELIESLKSGGYRTRTDHLPDGYRDAPIR